MKKRNFVVIAALIAAFMVVSCEWPIIDDGGDDGSGDGKDGGGSLAKLEGSWESTGGQKVVFSGNSFTRITNGSIDYKGTFSLSEETINFSISQYSLNGGSSWLSRDQLVDEILKASFGESEWNNLSDQQKKLFRDQFISLGVGLPSVTDSGTYELILDGKQLKIIHAGIGSESSRTVVYQKAGTSTVSTALVGQWANENAPSVVVLDFSTNQLQLKRGTTTSTYYTLETNGKIEVGTNPGAFTQVFCTSYTISGNTLTFTGGSSAEWYPSASFKKYVFSPATPTPLTADQWADGAITSSASEAWYSFSVTSGTTYRLWWNESGSSYGDGTKTLDVKVSGYYSDGTSITSFTDIDSAWATARSFTAASSGTVYIKVIPYSASGTGTFGIVYSSTATTRPGVIFNPPANATPLTAGQWTDGEITGSEVEAWYSFNVTGGNTFYVWWNEGGSASNGNRIKTLNVNVSAFYADGTSVTNFSNVDTAWATPRSFTPANDGTVYLRVNPYTSGSTGTYGIVYNTANTRPATPVAPANAIPLTADVWANGEITSASTNGEAWYSFAVESGTTYRLWGDGSGNGMLKTLQNMRVSVWYNNGDNILYDSSQWSSGMTINASSTGTVYVRIYSSTAGNTGTFGLVYSTASTRPNIPINPDEVPNLTELTVGRWANGEISSIGSGRAVWYSIDVTATAHYLWWNESGGYSYGDGTKTLDVSVSAWYADGTSVLTNVDTAWGTSRSFTPAASGTVYVRVTPYTSISTGTFGIVYNTNNIRPVEIPSNVTSLTADIWADGNITTAGGQQWFTFTATAATQYIHVIFRTLDRFYVQLYNSNGEPTGYNTEMVSNTRSTDRTLTVDQEYYIRISPAYVSGNGYYHIAFNASSTPPTAPPFNPPTAIVLTADEWAEGNATLGGEQWFTFTATATTQYIHVALGTLTNLYVQLYNSSSETAGSRANISSSSSTRYISGTLTVGQNYYVNVLPYSGTGSGNYHVTFNTSTVAPVAPPFNPPNSTALTENQWAAGNIAASGGQQWFAFTATAATQYIHVIFGTLDRFYVLLHDSTGEPVGSETDLYSSTRSINRPLTVGQNYYIRIWPYGSRNGTYQIAFNTSSTSP